MKILVSNSVIIPAEREDGKKVYVLQRPLDSVRISSDLTAVITANFDLLDPVELMVLKIASVLGTTVDIAVLESVSRREEGEGGRRREGEGD
jgi:predicted ATPase